MSVVKLHSSFCFLLSVKHKTFLDDFCRNTAETQGSVTDLQTELIRNSFCENNKNIVCVSILKLA